MKAISININDKAIKEIEINMQPNTVYTFFNSILIDEQLSIKNHIIYTDANALEETKTPYFLGEQLLLGDALITGISEHENKEVSISLEEFKTLVSYEVNEFYTSVLEVLSKTDINLYRSFRVKKENEAIELNTEWVLYTFNIADEKTREYFLTELKKSLDNSSSQEFIEKMAQLAMNASQ